MTNLTTPLPTGTWQLDPSATTVTVSAKKLLLWTIPATLTVVDGTIDVDDGGNVTSVEVTADAGSYTSKQEKRNEHIVGPDFLDAAKHPTIAFRTGAVTAGNTGFTTDGTVTIKGQTAAISVAVTDVDVSGPQPTFIATATVSRRALGIDKMPSFFVGDDLKLSVAATAKTTA